MKTKKKTRISRTIFVPFNVLYINFLPWVELNEEEIGDSIKMKLYNEDEEGANLRITGNPTEVHDLTDFLLDEIRETENEYLTHGYIPIK